MCEFASWVTQYCELSDFKNQFLDDNNMYKNKKIYNRLEKEDLYIRAILDFISGMTDQYAIKIFNELIQF